MASRADDSSAPQPQPQPQQASLFVSVLCTAISESSSLLPLSESVPLSLRNESSSSGLISVSFLYSSSSGFSSGWHSSSSPPPKPQPDSSSPQPASDSDSAVSSPVIVAVSVTLVPLGPHHMGVDVALRVVKKNDDQVEQEARSPCRGFSTCLKTSTRDVSATRTQIIDGVVTPTIKLAREIAQLNPLPDLLTLPEELKARIVQLTVTPKAKLKMIVRPAIQQATRRNIEQRLQGLVDDRVDPEPSPPHASEEARTLVTIAMTSKHLAHAADAAWRDVLDADYPEWQQRRENVNNEAPPRDVYRQMLSEERRAHRERLNFLRLVRQQEEARMARARQPPAPRLPPGFGIPGVVGGDYDRFPGGGGRGLGGGGPFGGPPGFGGGGGFGPRGGGGFGGGFF